MLHFSCICQWVIAVHVTFFFLLLQVSMGPLREALKIDENNLTLKAMPRLTKTHIEPNNFEKMRVSLAFQIFGSDSLSGLQLYKSQLEKCCGNIEPTQKFFRSVFFKTHFTYSIMPFTVAKHMLWRCCIKICRPFSQQILTAVIQWIFKLKYT